MTIHIESKTFLWLFPPSLIVPRYKITTNQHFSIQNKHFFFQYILWIELPSEDKSGYSLIINKLPEIRMIIPDWVQHVHKFI